MTQFPIVDVLSGATAQPRNRATAQPRNKRRKSFRPQNLSVVVMAFSSRVKILPTPSAPIFCSPKPGVTTSDGFPGSQKSFPTTPGWFLGSPKISAGTFAGFLTAKNPSPQRPMGFLAPKNRAAARSRHLFAAVCSFQAPPKAPEGWRTPRRFVFTARLVPRASVLECGGPPPLSTHRERLTYFNPP